MENKNAIVIQQNNAVQSVPIANGMSDIIKLGECVAKSGMFGEITPSTGTMVALTMYQERISPLDFSRRYHLIDGKISKRADATLAEFHQRGGKYKIIRADNECCEIDFSFDGNEIKGKMTIDDAKQSGIAISKGDELKKNWKKFPQQMLFARVVTNAVRMVMPDIVCGIYSPEEVSDFTDKPRSQQAQEKVESVIKETTQSIVNSPSTSSIADFVGVNDNDYSVCPIKGKLYGVSWHDMTQDVLKCAIEIDRSKHPEMTDEHIKAAQLAFEGMTIYECEVM